MNWMFPSGAVSKHLKNSADVVVSRFVCLYDEPICNVSTSTSKMYRFQSNDIPGNQTRQFKQNSLAMSIYFYF